MRHLGDSKSIFNFQTMSSIQNQQSEDQSDPMRSPTPPPIEETSQASSVMASPQQSPAGKSIDLLVPTPMTTTTKPHFIPMAPKMGGIDNVDTDKYVPWTGGKPLPNWTALENSIGQPSRPLQYRASGSAGVKSYTFRTAGLKQKFNKTSELEVFCTSVWDHLQECGMDTIAYLPDPANSSQMQSVVVNHGRFSLEYATEQSKKIQLSWDRFDKNNDGDAKQFLLNSLKFDFKRNIKQIVSEDASFAVLWITIMTKY